MMKKEHQKLENTLETKAILEEFRCFFQNNSIEKIGHNLKYDIKVLSNYKAFSRNHDGILIVGASKSSRLIAWT